MSHNEFIDDPESAKELPAAKRAVPSEREQKALFQQAVGGLQKREVRTKVKEGFEDFVRRLCIARGALHFSEIAATTALQWIGCTPESFANSNAVPFVACDGSKEDGGRRPLVIADCEAVGRGIEQ